MRVTWSAGRSSSPVCVSPVTEHSLDLFQCIQWPDVAGGVGVQLGFGDAQIPAGFLVEIP